MTDRRHIARHFRADFSALALASLAAAASIFLPLDPAIAFPVLVFLSVGSFSGLVVARMRADRAERAIGTLLANQAQLAARLIRLEQRLQMPDAASPALRSTVAEVTGTVGMLGGVVRELAINVAAHDRDMAELRNRLKGPVRFPDEARETRPLDEPSLLSAFRPVSEEERTRAKAMAQALDQDRIEIHLQPVVALPQRKIRFYEALPRLRLEDGTLIGPDEFLPVLERLGRVGEFDRKIVQRAMTVARHLLQRGSEAIVAVSLSPRSVAQASFLRALKSLFATAPEVLGRVVLQLPQDVWRSLDTERKAALIALHERGVPMGLDRAADLAFDAKALSELGVRFVRLPADLMIAAAQEEGREPDPRDYAQILRREGIKLIADRVEREDMVPALADLGVPLAQGFVFATPRPVKPEIFARTASEPAVEATPLRAAG